MTHWAMKYLGMPWANGGNSPATGYDCWNFVRMVQKEHYGIDVPVVNVDAFKIRDCIEAFSKERDMQHWHKAETPQDGDCVLMSQSKLPTHVGVWVQLNENDGGILHSVQGVGVVFTREAHLSSMSYNILGFYRYAG